MEPGHQPGHREKGRGIIRRFVFHKCSVFVLTAASNLCFVEICVILKITSCSCAFTCLFGAQKNPPLEGVIVIRYYLALRGAENGVTVMVTPFFCVQG